MTPALTQGDESYTKIYLEDGLQAIVDLYTSDDAIATTYNGNRIPKRILTNSMFYLYQLVLATDEFLYYAYEDMFLMLRMTNKNIVSDNYFAEVGFWDSIEDVKAGKETLVFGELPPSEDDEETADEKHEEVSMRLVTLCDGTSMGDQLLVFKTNAPVERLKELEKESCHVYIDGGDSEDVPIWANVLSDKGYTFELVAEHQHVTPYASSSEWLVNEYPEIQEHYTINNQPELK